MTLNEIRDDFRNSTTGKLSGGKRRVVVTNNMMNRFSTLGERVIQESAKGVSRLRDEWKKDGHILIRKNFIKEV